MICTFTKRFSKHSWASHRRRILTDVRQHARASVSVGLPASSASSSTPRHAAQATLIQRYMGSQGPTESEGVCGGRGELLMASDGQTLMTRGRARTCGSSARWEDHRTARSPRAAPAYTPQGAAGVRSEALPASHRMGQGDSAGSHSPPQRALTTGPGAQLDHRALAHVYKLLYRKSTEPERSTIHRKQGAWWAAPSTRGQAPLSPSITVARRCAEHIQVEQQRRMHRSDSRSQRGAPEVREKPPFAAKPDSSPPQPRRRGVARGPRTLAILSLSDLHIWGGIGLRRGGRD
jgi:hypothetical protein